MTASPKVGVARHVPAIDLLRGVSIAAVVWHHLAAADFPPGWWETSGWGFPGTWASHGWLGVNLFFILSGFVLYLPFAAGQRTLGSPADWREFWSHRARRLLPLYYFSALLLSALYAKFDWWQLLTVLTVTFNFSLDKSIYFPRANWVMWSLGIEIWFSLLFPAVVVALRRWGWHRVLPAVLLLSLTVRLLGSYWNTSAIGNDRGLNSIKDSLFGRLDDFVIGMLLAHWYSLGRTTRYPRLALATSAVVFTLGALAMDLALTGQGARALAALAYSAVQLAAMLLIPALIALPYRIRFIELCGMMSYSIYVWHGVMKVRIVGGSPNLENVTAYLVLLALVAWLSYRYIEFGHVASVRKLLPQPRT